MIPIYRLIKLMQQHRRSLSYFSVQGCRDYQLNGFRALPAVKTRIFDG
jgi:hypothetical protein